MSLSDQLKTESTKSITKLCKIGLLLLELSEEDKKSLNDAFETPRHLSNGLTNVQIHKILVSEGYPLGLSAVDRHRNKNCGCYRTAK
jgi:hypothetical protein